MKICGAIHGFAPFLFNHKTDERSERSISQNNPGHRRGIRQRISRDNKWEDKEVKPG